MVLLRHRLPEMRDKTRGKPPAIGLNLHRPVDSAMTAWATLALPRCNGSAQLSRQVASGARLPDNPRQL
jgi:hypothetical protein